MLRRRAGDGSRSELRDALAVAVVAASYLVCLIAIVLAPQERVSSLSAILGFAAVGAGVLVVGERDGLSVSASFIVYVLAAAFLGPASAAAAALISELSAAAMLRTPVRTIAFINLPTNLVPAVLAAVAIRALVSRPTDSARFYVVVAVVGSWRADRSASGCSRRYAGCSTAKRSSSASGPWSSFSPAGG